jgi:hypothetical protein
MPSNRKLDGPAPGPGGIVGFWIKHRERKSLRRKEKRGRRNGEGNTEKEIRRRKYEEGAEPPTPASGWPTSS